MNKEAKLPDLLARKQALQADIEGLGSVPLSLTVLTNKINIQALESVSSVESAENSLKRVRFLIAIGKSNKALREKILPDANQQLDQVNQHIQEKSEETQEKPVQASLLNAPKPLDNPPVQIVPIATRSNKNVTPDIIPNTKRDPRIQQTIQERTKQVLSDIVGTLPGKTVEEVASLCNGDEHKFMRELTELARTIAGIRDGEVKLPSDLDFLGIPIDRKEILATRSLHGIIASSILPSGRLRERDPGLKHTVGEKINSLIFLLGQKNGKDIFLKALSALPDLARLLIQKSMSTSLKCDLNFPDIDECGEGQFAEYIIFSARHLGNAEEWFGQTQVEKLRDVFDAFENRINTNHDAFNAEQVLVQILKRDDAAYIFDMIINRASQGEYLDIAEAFFALSNITTVYARKCRDLLTGGVKQSVLYDDE